MLALLDECRRNLEETLDYLADYWREDLDIDPDEMDKRLEEVDPELFDEEAGESVPVRDRPTGRKRKLAAAG